MTEPTEKFKEFLKERDEVLRSLNIEKVRAFYEKWNQTPGLRTPPREVQEIGMHKARTACLSLTKEERQFSKDWLTERGYRSLDDGDLS